MVLDEVVAVNSSDQAVCLEELFLPGGWGCVWEVTMYVVGVVIRASLL